MTIIKAPIERCFDLARSVEVHLAGNIHWGEEAIAAAGVTSGLVGLGQRVTWRARHFGIRHTLTSEITAMDRPGLFSGRHDQGPFRSMKHDHFFRARSDGETEMRDVFVFEAPLALLGTNRGDHFPRPLHGGSLARAECGSQASGRIGGVAAISCAWAMKIVIPGGSGQVGRILARHFHAKGHAITVFSRSPRPAPWRVVVWDGRTPGTGSSIWNRATCASTLAGRSVNCRYNAGQ